MTSQMSDLRHYDQDATNFTRHLASNEKEVREKSLEDVRRWMSKSPFDEINEGDMMKLWMGLYMSMYMADKPLVQERLAVNLASLVDCLSDSNEVFMFISAFFKIMRREWSSIDRLRIDKFYMLIRVMLGRTLLYLQQQQWDKHIIDQYQQLMSEALNTALAFVADGITFHIVQVFLTELKKVSDSHLSKDVTVVLLSPFVRLLATTSDPALRHFITDSIFEPLAVAIETAVKQKLSINPIAMSTEFLNLAKDPVLPRSTVNRKCLYQLHDRFAKASECVKQNVVANETKHSSNKKQKGKQGDVSAKETGNDNKGIGTPSDNGDIVTMDTTDNNTSSSCSDTVVDVTQGAKRMNTMRKRSSPAVNPSNNVALLEQNNGSSKTKKRKSLGSKMVDSIGKKEYATTSWDRCNKQRENKRYSLPNPRPSSESSVLLLEDNGHADDDHQRVISSPLRMTTRSGKMVGQASKKVKFALQNNKSFVYVDDQQTEFDHSMKSFESKVSEHKAVTTAPSYKISTRRKSSRLMKHS